LLGEKASWFHLQLKEREGNLVCLRGGEREEGNEELRKRRRRPDYSCCHQSRATVLSIWRGGGRDSRALFREKKEILEEKRGGFELFYTTYGRHRGERRWGANSKESGKRERELRV